MDSRKVRKIWQLIYDAFWFIPVEAIKSKIYSHRGNQINQSRRWQITFWLSPCSLATLSCTWPPRDPPPSQGLSWPSWGLAALPATEKTRSDLDEAAGTGKTTLSLARRGNCVSWCFPHPSWSTEDSSSDNSWKDFVLQFVGGLELLLLLLHHVRELLLVMCLQVVSQGFGGSLANLDDQGWTWEKEYLLTSDDLWASPLAGLYLHRRHFAMAPSKLCPKCLQTLVACFFRTTLFFWTGGMATGCRDEYVVLIFQFFLNIIWITKHSFVNSVLLHEMELHKMTKELALRP